MLTGTYPQPDRGKSNAPPPRSRLRPLLALAGLIAYGAIVAWATMSPTPLDQGYESAISRFLGVLHRNGIPEWFGYSRLEFTANIAMFIPLGFLIALVLPRRAWWASLLLIPFVSGAIEVAQYLLLSERFASGLDVAANTIGGYLGAVVAVGIRAAVYARDEKVVARALWDLDSRSRSGDQSSSAHRRSL